MAMAMAMAMVMAMVMVMGIADILPLSSAVLVCSTRLLCISVVTLVTFSFSIFSRNGSGYLSIVSVSSFPVERESVTMVLPQIIDNESDGDGKNLEHIY